MKKLLIGVAVFVTCPIVAAAQNPLSAVRDLYAAAEYEQTLTALGQLPVDIEEANVVEVDRYRALCLIALGRNEEADDVIESIVASDPLYQPASADAAPRVRAAFTSVRRRVLPVVARGLYAEGKAAFDRKTFPEAVERLARTLRVMDELEPADQAAIADLRTLAAGFLDLSRASLPIAAKPTAPEPAPAAAEASVDALPALPSSPPPSNPPPTDAVVIRQDMPVWSVALAGAVYEAEFRGIVEVAIDELGNVAGASIIESIHPLYDQVLLRATRDWKYQPARRGGQPVASRRRVEVVLRPR
jgi:TonB family protein